MERTRVAVLAALFVVLSAGGAAFAAGAPRSLVALGAVPWLVSTLLVSEVQTGGASASDEFAEITNVGASAVDLTGLELVYATSSGSTVTRKASWSTSLLLEPGRHMFVANAAGIYAGLADATYSGGFAATGGAIVLRAIGGTPIDAVGWGDATNTFVEGTPVGAPAAGSSIERRPGGLAGNTIDTNSNADDWFLQAAPNPQSLAAPPVPAPSPTPTPSPSTAPTPTPSVAPTASATPTVQPTAEPTATPAPTTTPTLAPTLSPTPTPEPTASQTPALTTEPTIEPTPVPTPVPTATPMPAPTTTPQPVVSISAARAQQDGTAASVIGVLTTPLGALESGRKSFVQDDSAGIALYLDAAVIDGLPAGTVVLASGIVDDRFAERTLRAGVVDVISLGEGVMPTPVLETTGAIGEAVEGARVLVTGVTVGSPSDLADGLGLMVDDGSGEVRVIVSPAALGGASVPSGTSVVAAGPVGQRDSSGTGLAGYRVHVTEPGDFQIVPPPTPSPTATPIPSPTVAPSPPPSPSPAPSLSPAPSFAPTPTPGSTPTAAPSPSATPIPTAAPTSAPAPSATPGPTPPPTIDIVEARGAPVGTIVTVAGVVTAEAGRLGIPPVIAIADGTGGIAVRLPEGVTAPARGTTVLVRGALADPYGQLELRPASAGFAVTGHGSLPAPMPLTASQLAEATEGRLAEITGTVTAPPRKSTSGDLAIDLVDGTGTAFRVIADGSSGIVGTDLVKDHDYRLTGIVGQRASRKGALDGYRLYVRDREDLFAVAGPGGPGSNASPAPVGGATASSISMALAVPDGTRLTIEATVTAGASLLDASGRRIVVQDRTGAIEILLPVGSHSPEIGAHLRVTGTTGRAWGAPRLAASDVTTLGAGAGISPVNLHRLPGERDEWQLVRISGTVAKVNRIGDRWRAEVTLADGSSGLVQGQAGAGIPSTAIVVGRRITVVGIVRRPYPTASDRRWTILPRSASDLDVGSGNGQAPGGSSGGGGTSIANGAASTPAANDVTPDTDLATLADAVGQEVKVGGLIARIAEGGFDLDDGTALARVELRGEMLALLPHLRAGEAIAATGRVELVDGAPIVAVDDDGTLVRVGTLGQALPIGAGAGPAATSGTAGAITADSSSGLGGPMPVSLLALAGLTALTALATVLRRRLLQRRLRLALVERLATFGANAGLGAGTGRVASAPASVVSGVAEHDSA